MIWQGVNNEYSFIRIFFDVTEWKQLITNTSWECMISLFQWLIGFDLRVVVIRKSWECMISSLGWPVSTLEWSSSGQVLMIITLKLKPVNQTNLLCILMMCWWFVLFLSEYPDISLSLYFGSRPYWILWKTFELIVITEKKFTL